MTDEERIETALAYHARTEHRLPNRFAAALGYLDWKTQPDPFRSYAGASAVALEEIEVGAGVERSWGEVRGRGVIEAAPIDARTIAQLFYDSMAISAWKQAGASRWALRCNPSSGNLHPTEAYLVCGGDVGLGDAGTFHYAPRLHALERRRTIATWGAETSGFGVALTSIVWREAWKYGERAFRYCMQDVGHAIGAIAIAARTLGWRVRVASVEHARLASLCAVEAQDGAEAERPDVLLWIDRGAGAMADAQAIDRWIETSEREDGEPNVLSATRHAWPVLEEVERATRGSGNEHEHEHEHEHGDEHEHENENEHENEHENERADAAAARLLVRRRRSAVDMDGVTGITLAQFVSFVRVLMPLASPTLHPLASPPAVHPVFFVHRVAGMAPGLAILVRNAAHERALRGAIRIGEDDVDADWIRLPGVPDDLPLFGIAAGDARGVAKLVSCGQDIAADGAFAVSMLARFEPTLRERGAHAYRELHWEAGLLGQLLYLEAEAQGAAATGIGCFFDGGVRELLGLEGGAFTPVYHFTVGGGVHDARIQTLPSYEGGRALLAERAKGNR